MIIQDQADIIAFLQDPHTYGGKDPVEHVETHISHIFLVKDRAYKLKRAVKLPYADFSTLELRCASCDIEVTLNSRTAPKLYLGTKSICRDEAGRLNLDGRGEVVDCVVEMQRFAQDNLFCHLAKAGKLDARLMTELAGAIAEFHQGAEIIHAGGGADNLAGVLDINEAGFATSHVFADQEVAQINASFRERLDEFAEILDERERAGAVRHCHGDMHLSNICLFEGHPQLFDCIEFNEKLATCDILYDLAFLLMDLCERGFTPLANLVMNRYFDATGDEEGLVLLPFLMAIRAAIRAHVTATQIEEGGDPALAEQAREYFDFARVLLERRDPALIFLGGLSGSGKSTIADLLAPKIGQLPGARTLESDRIRKQMFGVMPEVKLEHAAYVPELSEIVYRDLLGRSLVLAENGIPVVANAVFDRAENREELCRAARQAKLNPYCIWLDVDQDILRYRVTHRTKGPSDADLEVLEAQIANMSSVNDWHCVSANASPEETVEQIIAYCQ